MCVCQCQAIWPHGIGVMSHVISTHLNMYKKKRERERREEVENGMLIANLVQDPVHTVTLCHICCWHARLLPTLFDEPCS